MNSMLLRIGLCYSLATLAVDTDPFLCTRYRPYRTVGGVSRGVRGVGFRDPLNKSIPLLHVVKN